MAQEETHTSLGLLGLNVIIVLATGSLKKAYEQAAQLRLWTPANSRETTLLATIRLDTIIGLLQKL